MDPRRLLPALLLIALACLVLTLGVVAMRPTRDVAQAQPGAPAVAASSPAAREILATWDRARSAAWAHGRAGALTDLYLPGSPAGRADVASLRRWKARGFTVTRLQTQVLAIDIASQSASRLVLIVTDRVVGGRAVGAEGSYELPTDRASTRRVVLQKVQGRWVVAQVRDHRT